MSKNQKYTDGDVNKAYNMGLKSAIYVLEQAKQLTPEGIEYILASLRKFLHEDKDDEYQ